MIVRAVQSRMYPPSSHRVPSLHSRTGSISQRHASFADTRSRTIPFRQSLFELRIALFRPAATHPHHTISLRYQSSLKHARFLHQQPSSQPAQQHRYYHTLCTSRTLPNSRQCNHHNTTTTITIRVELDSLLTTAVVAISTTTSHAPLPGHSPTSIIEPSHPHNPLTMGCGSSKPTLAYPQPATAPQQVGPGNPAYDAYAAEQYARMKKDKKKKNALAASGGGIAAALGG